MNLNRLHSLAISESGFIFDPTTGNSFTSNETGKYILDSLISGLDEEGIIDKIFQEFSASKIEIENDYNDFMQRLRLYHLVENN